MQASLRGTRVRYRSVAPAVKPGSFFRTPRGGQRLRPSPVLNQDHDRFAYIVSTRPLQTRANSWMQMSQSMPWSRPPQWFQWTVHPGQLCSSFHFHNAEKTGEQCVSLPMPCIARRFHCRTLPFLFGHAWRRRWWTPPQIRYEEGLVAMLLRADRIYVLWTS